MANLNQKSTIEDIKKFLSFHIDNADNRKAKINPLLTKKQVWGISMGAALRGTAATRVHLIMIKNLKKEFGSYYEVEGDK